MNDVKLRKCMNCIIPINEIEMFIYILIENNL